MEEENKQPQDTFETRAKAFQGEYNQLKEKYGISTEVKLDFPQYKEYPEDVMLALAVISKHKNRFLIIYTDAKESAK